MRLAEEKPKPNSERLREFGDAALASLEHRLFSSAPITPELEALRTKLRECLAWYYFRPENVATRSPWGSMHAMIAYGVDTELIAGDKRVNAIGYLCYNGTCNGQRLFYLSNDKLQASIGPGVQGHPGQFLAMLAQSRVKTDFPILVDGKIVGGIGVSGVTSQQDGQIAKAGVDALK